jgi:hypothetical protein
LLDAQTTATRPAIPRSICVLSVCRTNPDVIRGHQPARPHRPPAFPRQRHSRRVHGVSSRVGEDRRLSTACLDSTQPHHPKGHVTTMTTK